MSAWKYVSKSISRSENIEEPRRAKGLSKLYDEIEASTTIYNIHTGEELDGTSIIQIISAIRDTPTLFYKWGSILRYSDHVHFSFEGEAYSDPAVITKYKMSRSRRDLFGGKGAGKIRRGKVKMVQQNTTFFHVGHVTDITFINKDEERCRELSQIIVMSYCKFEAWWRNRKGGYRVYCLSSSNPVTFKFAQSEEDLWSDNSNSTGKSKGTRRGFATKWRIDHMWSKWESNPRTYSSLHRTSLMEFEDRGKSKSMLTKTNSQTKMGGEVILVKS